MIPTTIYSYIISRTLLSRSRIHISLALVPTLVTLLIPFLQNHFVALFAYCVFTPYRLQRNRSVSDIASRSLTHFTCLFLEPNRFLPIPSMCAINCFVGVFAIKLAICVCFSFENDVVETLANKCAILGYIRYSCARRTETTFFGQVEELGYFACLA